jgi:hypothetical protein
MLNAEQGSWRTLLTWTESLGCAAASALLLFVGAGTAAVDSTEFASQLFIPAVSPSHGRGSYDLKPAMAGACRLDERVRQLEERSG